MKVLVVDDCADSQFLLSKLIEACGHPTRTASGASEAMVIGRDWRPEAVFLDLGLPGENGYSLARRLRFEAGLEGALIVAQSGYIDDEARRIASGIDAHLLKPVTMKTLCDILAAWEDRELVAG